MQNVAHCEDRVKMLVYDGTGLVLIWKRLEGAKRDAVKRLTESRRSAIVIRDERGPVVVTDRSLLNTLISEGEQPLSRVADRAFSGRTCSRTHSANTS
jgi:hypothetical protein